MIVNNELELFTERRSDRKVVESKKISRKKALVYSKETWKKVNHLFEFSKEEFKKAGRRKDRFIGTKFGFDCFLAKELHEF